MYISLCFLFPSSIKLSDLIFNSFITFVLNSKLSVVKFLCSQIPMRPLEDYSLVLGLDWAMVCSYNSTLVADLEH
jgi:hypothetical protein